MTRAASSTEEIDGSRMPPVLLHFDVNKTLIIADSIMNKSTEYTIREVIAKQFWGETQVQTVDSGEKRTVWRWNGRGPSMSPSSMAPMMQRHESAQSSVAHRASSGRPPASREKSEDGQVEIRSSSRTTTPRRTTPRRSANGGTPRCASSGHGSSGGVDSNRYQRPERRPRVLLAPPDQEQSGCVTPGRAHLTTPRKVSATPRKTPPSPVSVPPVLISYLKFLRSTIQDPSEFRLATRSFECVVDAECKQMMLELAEKASMSLTIPPALQAVELQKETGLVGEWKLIFPSFFRLIAHLQREGRHFAVSFRSFGTDLLRVRQEWNAFCEGRHPLLKECMEGVPRMDGSVPGVPDRRLLEDGLHTMYRDAEGPLLVLGTMTNGNWEGEWDQWAISDNQVDTRGGRAFMREQGLETVRGYMRLQSWWREQLYSSKTNVIREDFAWWHHSGEITTTGKLLIGIEDTQQVFFDDNIGESDCRIVDPRFANSFLPVPPSKCLGSACVQVDTLQAMLDESYFIDTFYAASVNPEVLWADQDVDGCLDKSMRSAGRSHRRDVEGSGLQGSPSYHSEGTYKSEQSDLEDGPRYVTDDMEEEEEGSSFGSTDSDESGKEPPLLVTDLDALRELLSSSGVEVEKFGAPGSTYKTVETLHQELLEKKCTLKRTALDGPVRVQREMEVMRMKLMCNNLILAETHEQLPDGRFRSRNGYLPATKKRHGESLGETIDRWAVEELQITITPEQNEKAVRSCEHKYDFTPETMSYPLPCATHYREVCCRLEPEQMPKALLDRLGLPAGSMFSTRGMKKKKQGGGNQAGSLRFWSWYRTEVWEAITLNEDVELPDVQAVMEELFDGHARRDAYSSLLLQMFDCFTASRLCGGLSGSLVLQVQPVDPIDGKNEEAVIVKLDKAAVVSREIANSKRVWNALSDRAARIYGQGCFYNDSTSVEYGAFKIELAGGCWQVPELAGGKSTKDLLMTFKDLLAVESQRQLLDTDMHHLVSTSGDVEVVLFELLGPGGMLRVLRREPLARSPRNLFGSFVYTGKDTKWNPLYQPNHFQLAPMRELWKRSFGMRGAALDMPDVRQKVQELTRRMASLESSPLGRYKPIVGFAHGDLNAMNVLIDVMDAVWLIDFAFSEEKPLCWDLAKMEVAFMFEYAVLPVYWMTLLDFAGESEEVWKARKVHTWLGVSEPVAYALLEELVAMKQQREAKAESHQPGRRRSMGIRRLPKRRGARMDQDYTGLQKAIVRACESVYKDQPLDRSKERRRDTELCRLCALLVTSQAEEEAALEQAAAVTQTMLLGETLQTVMEPPAVKLQKEEGASLMFCWSKAARLRLFFKEEWLQLRRRAERELGPLYIADESPLVHWLGLLQESYRLLGYFDVAPWVKVWAVFFLEGLVSRINHELDKADCALGRLQLEGQRQSKAVWSATLPRMYPDELEMALRTLAQRGGTPSSHASRRRIRSTHAKSADLCEIGGLFAEVRSLASVTVQERNMRAELVRPSVGTDGGFEEEATGVEIYVTSSQGNMQIGMLHLPEGDGRVAAPAKFFLAVPVVPLAENSLSQQDRRRGVRAFGEMPDGGQLVVVLAVTETAFCYPVGQRLSMAPNNIAPLRSGMRLQFCTVNEYNERTGNYSVTYDNVQKNAFEDTEVDPFEGNHLQAQAYSYKEGTRLAVFCRESGGRFADAVVSKEKKEGTARHLVKLEGLGAEKSVYLDMNDFNHARRHVRFNQEVNEEEARRYRVFVKAKHSFIYTVTSERADVLEGPVPRMADETGREAFFWSEVQALIAEDDERLSSHIFFQGTLILGEHGSGKSSLLCKLVMHCLSHSTLLLPVLIPVLEICSRLQKASGFDPEGAGNDGEGLVDWYLRMVYGGDTNRFFMLHQAMECHRLLFLFDGVDEAGPWIPLIERCISGLVALNHRVVATARLQDDDISEYTPKDIGGQALRYTNHLYPSWLKTSPQLFKVFELLPLELECRRSLVEVLLAREQALSTDDYQIATDFVEDFIMNLDEDEGRKWSTPMMVSMLVASWREKKSQDERRANKAEDAWNNFRTFTRISRSSNVSPSSQADTPTWCRKELSSSAAGAMSPTGGSRMLASGVDMREVYRVALDLLLRRFQSRRQADRHKMKDTVQKFKELLVLIAQQLSPGIKEFKEGDVLPLLTLHHLELQVWKDLSEAIRQGRVPLVQSKVDRQDGETRFTFTYSSFQRFLSSGCAPSRGLLRHSMANFTVHAGGYASEQPLSTTELPALAQMLSPRRVSAHIAQTSLLWNLLAGWTCCICPRNVNHDRSPGPLLYEDGTVTGGTMRSRVRPLPIKP